MYFLSIYLSKGQVRLMTYLSTDQNHLSGATGHRFCRTRISIILYLYIINQGSKLVTNWSHYAIVFWVVRLKVHV